MFELRKKLAGISEGILKEKFGVSTTVHFDFALDEGRGDLTTSVALQLAKKLRKKPQDVAEVIAQSLRAAAGVSKVQVAGSGYVNVTLDDAVLSQGLEAVEHACEPRQAGTGDAPIIIDFFGPNIAKPLGIQHILTAVIGQAIINLYRHCGFSVIGWSYPGDWGTQFGKLAVAYQKWGSRKPVGKYTVDELLALYVRFHREAEKNVSLEDEARKEFAKLEAGDPVLRAFREEVVDVTQKALSKLCERLHVKVDRETGESFYEDKMDPILREGTTKKVFKKGEGGALIVEFPLETHLPPSLLKKSDGTTLYATRDLAMVRYRLDSCHPRAIYYVVGVAQSLYLQQLFATCTLLGWDLPETEHTVFGHMRFEDASMSTRKGTSMKLEDVLDEGVRRATKVIEEHRASIQTDDARALAEMMGVGALVYGILNQNRKMDLVFDWDKCLSFEGNSAPYLQYTYARARSVLRKADRENVPLPAARGLSPKERLCLKILLRFPETLADARDTRMPHKLTNYLFELCQAFNSFYNSEPILQAEPALCAFRLGLTSLTARVLKTGAELLTLRVSERM